VAASILRLKLEHVTVVAFDTVAHVLVRAGEDVGVREVARRVLSVPAQGYTNIEGGLDAGLEQLRRARLRERVGIVFTDGVANVGWDPVRVAGRYPRLHVVHLGEHHVQGARCCRDMARAGRGKLYRARTYGDLPQVVRGAVRELFR
jgi:Mg-chelatase subunit ChlD